MTRSSESTISSSLMSRRPAARRTQSSAADPADEQRHDAGDDEPWVDRVRIARVSLGGGRGLRPARRAVRWRRTSRSSARRRGRAAPSARSGARSDAGGPDPHAASGSSPSSSSSSLGRGAADGVLVADEHRPVDVLLAAEIPVDERVAHAGLGGDVPHRDGREAALGEELLGCVQDGRGRLLPAAAPLSRTCPWPMMILRSPDDAPTTVGGTLQHHASAAITMW